MKPSTLHKLAADAQQILQSNLQEVEGKLFAMPSKELYPAAWGWDTPQIAAGLYDQQPNQALKLMEDFLSFQRADGMVPQIVFPALKPGERFDKDAYFPGPHVWYITDDTIQDYDTVKAQSFTEHPLYHETGGQSTGIPQYPIWALNLKQMHSKNPIPADRLAPLVEKLDAFHRYFHEQCDPEGLGIVAEMHPWLGCDNAPPYDAAMARIADTASQAELQSIQRQRVDVESVVAAGGDISHRPTDRDYAAFLKIAHGIAAADAKRAQGEAVSTDDLPFVHYSPMLNGMLIRAEEDLAQLAFDAGLPDMATQAQARAASLRDHMMQHLWDEPSQSFAYLDAKSGERLTNTHFIGALMPLLDAKLPAFAKAALEETLADEFVKGYPQPMPTTSKESPEYEACYWRGPAWVNMTELLRPHTPNPEHIRDAMLDAIAREGFCEFFHPETGEGMGSRDFGWTAAYGAQMVQEAMREMPHQSRLLEQQTQANRGALPNRA